MSLLSQVIRTHFGESLASAEAHQLAFRIFCSVDWLPESLKTLQWDRIKIADEFAAVAKEGFVCDVTPGMQSPAYWNQIIDDFLSRRLEIDHALAMRLCHR